MNPAFVGACRSAVCCASWQIFTNAPRFGYEPQFVDPQSSFDGLLSDAGSP